MAKSLKLSDGAGDEARSARGLVRRAARAMTCPAATPQRGGVSVQPIGDMIHIFNTENN